MTFDNPTPVDTMTVNATDLLDVNNPMIVHKIQTTKNNQTIVTELSPPEDDPVMLVGFHIPSVKYCHSHATVLM